MAELGSNQVLTGARARFTLNGKTVAWAYGVSWSEELTQDPVDVLDKLEPVEYAYTGYRVTLSAQVYRVPGESLKSGLLWPKNNGSSEDLKNNVYGFAEMEAVIEDSRTGTVIASFTKVKPQARNLSVTPRGIVGKNVTFTAIYIVRED